MARRTVEDQIKKLEAKILTIKERAERQKVKKNPAVKPLSAALRYVDKALNATDDKAIRGSLDEARGNLSACLGLLGVTSKPTRTSKARGPRASKEAAGIDSNALLTYIRNNPGQRSEDINAEFQSDAATLRVAMKGLIEAGQVKTEGQKRGTRYFTADKRSRAAQ